MADDNHIPPFSVIERAVRAATQHFVKDVETFADSRRTDFIRRIEAQKFPAIKQFPLSPQYAARKRRADADPRTLIATAHYLSEIKRQPTQQISKDKHIVSIAIDEDAVAYDLKGKPTDTPLNLVARVLEKGSAAMNIPPRPHWAPFVYETKLMLRRWRLKEASNLSRTAQQYLTVGVGPSTPAA